MLSALRKICRKMASANAYMLLTAAMSRIRKYMEEPRAAMGRYTSRC